jgi:hypothetical protein
MRKFMFTYGAITIGIHQLSERSVSFDFELNDCIVLTQYFEVDVFALVSLFALQFERIRQLEMTTLLTYKCCTLIHRHSHTQTQFSMYLHTDFPSKMVHQLPECFSHCQFVEIASAIAANSFHNLCLRFSELVIK